ncbi:pilus assembly protein PilZ [Sulfitobacter alexandrii]|uniref:Pilus assembly protein PilZ n=1 Tax=Sulfitobacter alexandrii TaxID=1917485 RepID=A0A1J0WHT9_9RHOB|nr:pilus assembly protein PilZ [Sulfitobacter alexandrii]APE43895.1 pilus assembly protein PilZ [Sulfitobacter alexandrii]
MSNTDTQHPTPRNVADLATTEARLDRTALIGIFGSETAPGALVRTPNGRITRVGLGDTVAGGTVAAIGEGQLVLNVRGRAKALKLPQG